MTQVVVIPARYASTRLPGKPLVDIAGVPMIVRTWRQCAEVVDASVIFVATDDARIGEVCERHGMQWRMTSDRCLTGTDRVAEFAKAHSADTYINVQGDEPLFNPADLMALMEAAKASPDEIINGYCPITSEDDFRSSAVPKVVSRPDGRLLYMSRAAIPTTKAFGFERAWRQVCAYAFPAGALDAFAAHGRKTRCEAIEDIEILRFLELGYEVRMIEMSDQSVAVDLPEHVQRVVERLNQPSNA